jgi:hypothetical protein
MEDIQAPTVAARQVSLIANLHHLTLIPKYYAGNTIMQGIDLFDHMCHFQNLNHATTKGKGWNKDKIPWMEPSPGLGVHVYDNSLDLFQPTLYNLSWGEF